MGQFRQGDVFLKKVSAPASKNLKDVARENGLVVLAHGEVTGHCHSIASASACLLESEDGTRYLHAEKPVSLDHQEHATIDLDEGWYEVRRQREYTPEAVRNVMD